MSRIIHEQAEKLPAASKTKTEGVSSDEDEDDDDLENIFIEFKDFKLASKRV